MGSDDQAPFISKEIIEFLTKSYPETFPRQELSAWEMGVRTGQLRVIDHLRYIHEDQVKVALTGDLE